MENVKEWITEWCNLWPDVKWNNVSVKSTEIECVKKMINFCKNFPIYKKDIIFAGTKLYLEEKEKDNWEYIKRSTYFINKKGEPSMLEIYCNKIIENDVVIDEDKIQPNYNYYNDWI